MKFVPVKARTRTGTSKLRILRDGSRFFLIILRVAVFFSPIKVFLPASLAAFAVAAGFYAWHLAAGWEHPVTGGIQVMALFGALVFAIGLLSEQIASLRFDRSESE